MSLQTFPTRKKLPHEIPSWVADGSRYFITVNCESRGVDVLCSGGTADRLLQSVEVYEQRGVWRVLAMMIMPDHIHFIATFPREPGIQSTMQSWKRYFARSLGIAWQSGFFEHRLRNDAEFSEKMSYVLLNPVRKGLVANWQDWPHCFARGNW